MQICLCVLFEMKSILEQAFSSSAILPVGIGDNPELSNRGSEAL
jgi:hypothetical protein